MQSEPLQDNVLKRMLSVIGWSGDVSLVAACACTSSGRPFLLALQANGSLRAWDLSDPANPRRAASQRLPLPPSAAAAADGAATLVPTALRAGAAAPGSDVTPLVVHAHSMGFPAAGRLHVYALRWAPGSSSFACTYECELAGGAGRVRDLAVTPRSCWALCDAPAAASAGMGEGATLRCWLLEAPNEPQAVALLEEELPGLAAGAVRPSCATPPINAARKSNQLRQPTYPSIKDHRVEA